jgi:hypothetical protein
MVNSDFVNPIEKLLDLQWFISALDTTVHYRYSLQVLCGKSEKLGPRPRNVQGCFMQFFER